MVEGPLAHGQHRRFAANNRAWRWAGTIGLAAAIGLAYFLAARLSVGLVLKPEGVAVFWPAAGISAGVLIALGPHARWPVAAGVAAARPAAESPRGAQAVAAAAQAFAERLRVKVHGLAA